MMTEDKIALLMRLKSLELQGYKTFASQTVFEFAGLITAIVGPNGSGKSNVADSLRWVLGEQSYSLLRGKKTADMIFSGSESRPRAGMASVTVVFDNSDGWLPIDFSEVSITRRAYRDGQNEYLVNGQRVRLKNVNELLGQSGLAERTYTIIGQGVVDAALSLKAEERRRLFEEAAGIGLYRARREEAQRRLETTRRNLERVQDILAELSPRLRSLERQAKRAREFEQIRADLQVMLREWYGYHWHLAQGELREARDLARQRESKLEQARKSYQELDEQIAFKRAQLQGVRARLNDWHRQIALLHTRREELSTQTAVVEERLRSWLEQRQNAQVELVRLQEELGLDRERFLAAEKDVERLNTELSEARAQAEEAFSMLQKHQKERANAEGVVLASRQALAALNRSQGELQARLTERRALAERQSGELSEAEIALEAANNEISLAQKRASESQTAYSRTEFDRAEAEKALQDQRQRRINAEASLKALQEEGAALSAELARLKAQMDVIEQAETALSGYARGAQALIKSVRQGRLKGAKGALNTFLDVPAELETAIAAALGEFLDSLVLDGVAGIDLGLSILHEESARGILLPLEAISPPAEIRVEDDDPNLIGVASRLIQTPSELRPVVNLLLGRTLVVKNREVAREFLEKYRETDGLRVVTLQGDVFLSGGPVLAGGEATQVTLARPRQRKSLEDRIVSLQKQVTLHDGRQREGESEVERLLGEEIKLEKALQEARQVEAKAIATYNQDAMVVDTLKQQIKWHTERVNRLTEEINHANSEAADLMAEHSKVEEKITLAREEVRRNESRVGELSLDEYQSQVGFWKTQVAVAERALADVQTRFDERVSRVDDTQNSLDAASHRMVELDDSFKELETEKANLKQAAADVSQQIDALHIQIEPAETELEQMESDQDTILDTETAARQELNKEEHLHAQAKIAMARKKEALESWRRRIEDDFGLVAFDYAEEVSGPTPLPLSGMVERLPRIKSLSPDMEENVRRLRAQLRRMGPINQEAQDEYHEVKQRYEFMTEQVSDLQQAEADVQQVIVELDELMQRELRRTFDAVAEEFSEMFTRLFGGGSARLLLTDPEDMSSTGVDIEARLPGKRMQGLSLLSGGERSLTATALIFALLKVSPTPFCLLDEVDAMLDEANVGRFRELLRELSRNTQFVVVTHNRSTVQVADVIYGVTMGRDSTSQVISLKMDEVEKVVD